MRKTCLECVMKHLGSAAVFIKETEMGCPFYRGYVYGELDHAADECFDEHPYLAMCIRQHRINWSTKQKYKIPFESLFDYIDMLERTGSDIEIPDSVMAGIDTDEKGNPIYSMDTRP